MELLQQDLLKYAKMFIRNGFSIVPVKLKDKRALVEWEQYQYRLLTEGETETLFGPLDPDNHAIAVICGKVSGNLELIDFDTKIPDLDAVYNEFTQIEEVKPLLDKCLIERSPRGGYHIFYRTEFLQGNQKLALVKNEVEVKGEKKMRPEAFIETRGEGGYCLCSPSKGYNLISGKFSQLTAITKEERDVLITACRSFTRVIDVPKDNFKEVKSGSSGRPIEAYNESQEAYEEVKLLLEREGWKPAGKRGEFENYTRPGKRSGVSGGFIEGRVFKVFSSNAHPFEVDKSYSLFGIFCELMHAGDAKAAVKDLRARGFGKSEDGEEEEELSEKFYFEGETSKNEPKLMINNANFLFFLNKNGFYKFYLNNQFVFVRITDNIIEEVTPAKIQDFTFQWIEALPDKVTEHFSKLQLINLLSAQVKFYFSEKFLSLVQTRHLETKRDKKKTGYLFYRNCWVEVDQDGYEVREYKDLDRPIWKRQILQRDFKDVGEAPQDFSFRLFLRNVCSGNEERYNSLRSAIGYLIHTCKDSATTKAVIFCDEGEADNDDPYDCKGRSGKTIVAKAIGSMRNMVFIDGKQFRFDKNFAFQKVSLDTQVILFDDVTLKFQFHNLFSVITGALTIEKKGKDEIEIPFENAPKILLTTNYTVQDESDSARARKFEIEFSRFYNLQHSPVDDFGKRFFDDWTPEEWQYFDAFMLECVGLYLEHGLMTYKFVNLENRKLIQMTSPEFLDFMEAVRADKYRMHTFKRSQEYEKFIERHPKLSAGITQNKFSRWVLYWAEQMEYMIEKKRVMSDRIFRIYREGDPEPEPEPRNDLGF